MAKKKAKKKAKKSPKRVAAAKKGARKRARKKSARRKSAKAAAKKAARTRREVSKAGCVLGSHKMPRKLFSTPKVRCPGAPGAKDESESGRILQARGQRSMSMRASIKQAAKGR